jgi:hypothetical protein
MRSASFRSHKACKSKPKPVRPSSPKAEVTGSNPVGCANQLNEFMLSRVLG